MKEGALPSRGREEAEGAGWHTGRLPCVGVISDWPLSTLPRPYHGARAQKKTGRMIDTL